LPNAIEVIGATKEYTTKEDGAKRVVRAVDNVDLTVRPREFVGLLGPNGAGKTTLIKILGTLILPTAGTARIAGYDVVKEAAMARSSFGWLHGETGGRALYWRLTALENLRFYSALQNVPKEVAEKRIEILLDFFELTKDRSRLVKDFSTGIKVRVMLARSLLANPPILLMDEPTVGLDPNSADETRRLLTALNEELGKTILFTSHNMTEVERLVKRVAIMHRGRIIADERPSVLRRLHHDSEGVDLEVESSQGLEVLKARVASLPGVREVVSVRDMGSEFSFRLRVEDETEAVYEIPNQLRKLGIGVMGISKAKLSLEEVFLKLTRG
jgi:ABC-2 type transport system ATP-binding protein